MLKLLPIGVIIIAAITGYIYFLYSNRLPKLDKENTDQVIQTDNAASSVMTTPIKDAQPKQENNSSEIKEVSEKVETLENTVADLQNRVGDLER